MADKKALLVIDMQNDYLWEARKAKFSYPTKELVDAVNEAAAAYQSRDTTSSISCRCSRT